MLEANEEIAALVRGRYGDEDLADEWDDWLYEAADSTCTTGYDNDGSTGFEIFSNGLELGASLKEGEEVVVVRHPDRLVAWFFVGTQESVLDRLRKGPRCEHPWHEEGGPRTCPRCGSDGTSD